MHHQAVLHHHPWLINHLRYITVSQLEHSFEVNPFAATEHEPFVNVFAPDPNFEASSSGTLTITTPNQSTQPHEHLRKWTDSHPLDNIIGNPSQSVLCGASTIQYCPKSNLKTSNLLLLKTTGFKPSKMKSMNLID
ncbi:hypothetical protein Tco_0275000, partial [Tanacetum coccineum]